MPARVLAALLAVSSAACLDADEPNAPAIPDGVGWVAYVPEIPGALGSALWSYRADEPLVFPVDTGRTWRALGYPTDLLDTYDVEASRGQSTPLEWVEAGDCGQLPPPLWEARLTAGSGPAGPAHVRAGWSRDCANDLSAQPGGVDLRCPALPGCGATFTRDRCTVTFDAETCDSRDFVAELAWRGPACLRPAPGCVRVAEDPSSARWQCGDCELETYPDTPARTWTARTRRLTTLTATQVPEGQLVPGVQLRQLEQGGVSALALRGQEAWVAVRRSPVISHRMCAISEAMYHDGTIVRLDRETLAPVGTSSAAGRCITRLVPDPLGPGMLATFYVSDVLHVGRYGAAGEPLAAVPLERRTPTSEAVDRAVAMVVTSSRSTVVVEYFERSGEAVDDGMVYVLDTATLQPRRALFRDGPVRGVAWAPRSEAVVVVVANGLLRLAVPTLDEIATARLPVLAEPLYPRVLEDGRVLVSDPRQAQGLVEFEGVSRVRGVSRVSTYGAVITDLLVSPAAAPEGLAMLLTTPDSGRTSWAGLARVSLDRAQGVRVAPQVWRVVDESGEPVRSAVTQPTLDAEGRVWALAPWTGHVLRFDVPPAP